MNEEDQLNVISKNSIRNGDFEENFENHMAFNEKREDLD